MPTKYRTQSANVLNEADSFERKLDWMLFKSEQEKILYGGGENEWKPGDSLVEAMWETNKAAWPDDYMFWEGSPGVYDRPMIQEYEDGEHYRYMRCADCLVDFPSTVANCWFCGQEYEVHLPESAYEKLFNDGVMLRALMPDVRARRGGLRFGVDHARIGQINSSEITDEGLVVHGTFEGTTFLSVDPARPRSTEPTIDCLESYDIDFDQYCYLAEARASDGERISSRTIVNREDLAAHEDVTAFVSQIHNQLREHVRSQLRDYEAVLSEAEERRQQEMFQPRFTLNDWVTNYVSFDIEAALAEDMMRMFAGIVPPHVQVAEQADETPVCSEFDATFASDNLFMAEADPDVPFVLPREVDLTPRRREVPVPIIDVSGGSLQRRIQDNRYYDSTPITEQRRTR